MNSLIKFVILTIFFSFSITHLDAQSIDLAIKYYDRRNYKNAEELFHKINEQKRDLKALYYLGSIELERENDSLANKYFSQIIQRNNNYPLAYVGLGKLALNNSKNDSAGYYFKKASSLSKGVDTEVLLEMAEYMVRHKADSSLTKEFIMQSIKSEPSSPKGYLLLGDWYLIYKNDGTKAVIQYNAAMDKNPDLPDPFLKIGTLYLRSGHFFDLAKNMYSQAIEKDSMYAPSYRAMAELYYKFGKYKEARTYFEKYLSLSEANSATLLQYVYLLIRYRNYADALEVIHEVREKANPALPFFRFSGYSHYELENYDSCVKDMRYFIKHSPSKKIIPLDYEYLARALHKLDEDSLSIRNFKKALALDSSDYSLYKELADIYIDNKDYEDAISCYNKFLNDSSNRKASNYYSLAKAYYFNKDFKNADSVFTIVNMLAPDYSYAYLYRARCNKEDSAQARNLYEKYLSLIDTTDELTLPFFKEAYYNLAYYAILKQDVNKAREYYNKVLEVDPKDENAKKYLRELKRQMSLSKQTQKK